MVEPLHLPEFGRGEGTCTLSIDASLVTVPASAVHQELGYGDAGADQYFTDVIDDLLLRLPQYLAVHAGYRIVALDPPQGRDHLAGAGVRFAVGATVFRALRKSTSLAVFACTIGDGFERYTRELSAEGEVAESHIADTIASLAAEKVASLVHGHIAAVVQDEGNGFSNRYSPGYCGWTVAQQQELFSLLPKGFCGISLSASSLMAPVKSVSGIVGIGNEVTWHPYGCATCGRKKCTYRTYLSEREKHVPLL